MITTDIHVIFGQGRRMKEMRLMAALSTIAQQEKASNILDLT